MSSEVCPFCGKTYKRLKSHLPYCKAAANSQKTPNLKDVKSDQTSSSESVTAASEKRETHSQSKKISNVSAAPLQSPCPAVATKVASALSSDSSTTSLPSPLSQNKKTKEFKKIKKTTTQNLPPSTTEPSSSPSLTVSNKKRVVTLKQATTLGQGAPQVTTSASRDPYTCSKTTAQTNQTNMGSESEANSPLKKKTSKTKKALESSTPKSDCSNSISKKYTNKSCVKDSLLKDNTEKSKNSNPCVTHPSRITVQGVKALLARPKTIPQSSRGSVLNNNDNLSIKTHLDSSFSSVTAPVENHTNISSHLQHSQTVANHLPSTRQQTDLQSVTKTCMSLTPLQHNNSSRSKQTFPTTALTSSHLSTQLNLAANKGTLTEALKSNQTHPLSLSTSPHQISTPHICPPDANTGSLRTEWQKIAPVAGRQQLLGQVKLRELPEWLASRVPGHPRGVVDLFQQGWHWYCRKYIYVRKGGVGGLSMLLAGYCVLGYIWNYSHIKRDRWRKYH